eukprot:5694868-Pyramimonas_sp.AAC.1
MKGHATTRHLIRSSSTFVRPGLQGPHRMNSIERESQMTRPPEHTEYGPPSPSSPRCHKTGHRRWTRPCPLVVAWPE